MRFKQYLTEKNNRLLSEEEIISYIKQNCKPILRFYKSNKGRFLWRGMSNSYDGFVSTTRKDRMPMNTSYDIHVTIDKLSEKKFGWKMRSEGLFTTTSKTTANGYGISYMVFPVGNFKFVYHPEWDDSFVNIPDIDMTDDELREVVIDKYTDKNLKKAFDDNTNFGTEVILNVKEYVGIHYKFEDMIRETL